MKGDKLYIFRHLYGSFPLELIPSMVASAQGRDDRLESDEVHELPVKKPLDEYDPDMRERVLIERIRGTRYDRIHEEECDISDEYGLQIPEEYGREEYDIADRGECREYDLEKEHVRKCYVPEGSLSEGSPVFPEALECPVTPPESLLEERSNPLRGLCHAFCERRIHDASAVFEEREREVRILHERIARVPAYIEHSLFSPGAGRSRYDRYAVERVEGTPIVVLSGDVFDLLEGGQDILHVSDSDVPAYRIHLAIGKRFHQVENGFREHDGISIHRDDIVVLRLPESHVECDGFAFVLLRDEPDIRVFFRHPLYAFGRSIRASIVYDEDLELRIVTRKESGNRALYDGLFIVGRDQYGHRGHFQESPLDVLLLRPI